MEGFLKNLFLLIVSLAVSIGLSLLSKSMGLGTPSHFEVLIFAFVFRIYITAPNNAPK